MRGHIEVYKNFGSNNQKLISKGPNTVVDGAGELIADMMTAHTSLSAIPDLSSILDTSNYTIQALSLGKDSQGYRKHGHEWGDQVSKKVAMQRGSSPSKILVIASSVDLSVSSYYPSSVGNILPSFVSPRQTKLEENTIPSGIWATIYLSDWSDVKDMGHNLNIIAYRQQALDSGVITFSAIGDVLGCYPDGSGMGGTDFYVVSSGNNFNTGDSDVSAAIFSGTYNSLFNQVSSMDLSGFIDFVGSSTTDTMLMAGYSGVTVSADTTPATHASTTGEIAYQVVIGSGDLGCANLYGGIYNIGLWGMDLCSALKSNNPPFIFDPLTNQKKYKLFSKKSLLDNLATINDGVGPGALAYDDLTLIWRLFFI